MAKAKTLEQARTDKDNSDRHPRIDKDKQTGIDKFAREISLPSDCESELHEVTIACTNGWTTAKAHTHLFARQYADGPSPTRTPAV